MPIEIVRNVKNKIEELRPHIINSPSIGNLKLMERARAMPLLKGNPVALGNLQIGKGIRDRLQMVRGGTRASPSPRTKKGGEKVFIDRPKGVRERVIVV